MTDSNAKVQPNANDRRERAKPKQPDEQSPQSDDSPAPPPTERTSSGRRPLFRT
jgi:hypothetical protein